MAVSLKKKNAESDELFNVIHADKKEIKSKAAPPDCKTMLLYIPSKVQQQARIRAAQMNIRMHDYYIRAIEAFNNAAD